MTSVVYLQRAKQLFEATPPENRATSALAQKAWRAAQEVAHAEYLQTLPPCGFCRGQHLSVDCPAFDEMTPTTGETA